MLDISFSRKLADSGFERRATPAPDGRIVYQLADKSAHVSIGKAEWDGLFEEFSDRVRRVHRTVKWWFVGLFPGILVFAMTIGQILPGAGLLILLGIFLGPPTIYLWQSYQVRRAAEAVEFKLALGSRIAAPPPKPFQAPRWLEVGSFVLVGPHLVFEVVGSLYPAAYRNTPLVGTELNGLSAASLAILAAILYLKWRASHLKKVGAENRRDRPKGEPELPQPRGFGRKVDVVARVRSTTT